MMTAKIHIMHVLLSLQPGGLENGVVNVINRLSPTRFRSSVCCLKQAGEFSSRIQSKSVAIHELGWRSGNDLLLPLRLARLFRQTKPDIVHTRNAEAFFYGFLGAKMAGIPSIIHSEHGRTFNDRPLRFKLQKLFSRYTNALFAVSTQLKSDLVRHVDIPADRIEVLHNGVDLDRFTPTSKALARNRLGLDQETLIIGSVGRLVTVKNYQLLLRALHVLGKNNVVVLLVGDGPERKPLEDLADSLGLRAQVRFAGHREDVSEILGAMDIFVLSSLSEGMSNTLLEAMAAGIPVVASNVGGNSEIVDDEVSGMLFETNDVDSLRIKLDALITNPELRTRLGDAAQKRIFSEFAIDSMIARYETLYQSTLAAHGDRP